MITDTGWQRWADRMDVPDDQLEKLADDCVMHLQRRPKERYFAVIAGSALAVAVRHDDGTILAWQTDVRAERMVEP